MRRQSFPVAVFPPCCLIVTSTPFCRAIGPSCFRFVIQMSSAAGLDLAERENDPDARGRGLLDAPRVNFDRVRVLRRRSRRTSSPAAAPASGSDPRVSSLLAGGASFAITGSRRAGLFWCVVPQATYLYPASRIPSSARSSGNAAYGRVMHASWNFVGAPAAALRAAGAGREVL